MKRFLLFLAVVVTLVMFAALLAQVATLSTQVGELTARVQEVEQAGSVSIVPGPSITPTRTPTTAVNDSSVPVPTRTPTRTPTATVTPAATPHFTVNSAWVNVRTGPGDVYPIIDAVPQGEQFDIIARNPAGTWLEFCCVKEQRGWIYAPLLDISVDPTVVPTASTTPIPPSPTPTNTPSNGGGGSSGGGGGNGLGITIAPENRCSPYNQRDYSYPQSVEPRIVAQQGNRIYGPYSGRYFASTGETDIEHIVARSEAHDSGLCAVDSAARKAFGRDLLNLTLASPRVNRYEKIAKDLAEWLPALNHCWYVNQVVLVKRKYNLTMDQAEASTAQRVLAGCAKPIVMQFTDPGSAPPPPPRPCPSNCTQAHAMGMSNMGTDHACYQTEIRSRSGWYRL